MIRVVLLDAGPLGQLSHPRKNHEIQFWLRRLLHAGVDVVVPEIADYEVRRELRRIGSIRGIERLDLLACLARYLPITTAAMREAAELWAQARREGLPTADPKALDGDVILAAQAIVLRGSGYAPVVATDNVGHLSRYCSAKMWTEID